jgi:hypothetical protein
VTLMDALKYLPLLEVIAKHPTLVQAFTKIAAEVQPLIPEINQALIEAEAILTRIQTQRSAAQ